MFEYLFAPGKLLRTVGRSARGYRIIAKLMPFYAGNWRLLLPFALAGVALTAVRRQRYLLWSAFWVLLPFSVVMSVGVDDRFFMFLYPVYALLAVVGVYPFLFGLLYYLRPSTHGDAGAA